MYRLFMKRFQNLFMFATNLLNTEGSDHMYIIKAILW